MPHLVVVNEEREGTRLFMRQQQELLLPGDLAEGEEHCTGHFLLSLPRGSSCGSVRKSIPSPYMARSVATACTLLLVAQDLSRSRMLCRPVREAPSSTGPPGAGAARLPHVSAAAALLRHAWIARPARATVGPPCILYSRSTAPPCKSPMAHGVAGGHERDSGGI